MKWKYDGHIQGTNCSEFECSECGCIVVLPELPESELPDSCPKCGSIEEQEPTP